MEEEKETNVDDNLYSRTRMAYGRETMVKLSHLKVFIYGLRGLGIEVAKNIILNGCEEVSIYDSNIVKINDLGSNFYLSEKDVGKKRRDEACLPKLTELNPNINVNILDIDIKENEDSEEFILINKIFHQEIIYILNENNKYTV